jgi:1-acyl-sn-glycerol-3-phosphate acyltransferase
MYALLRAAAGVALRWYYRDIRIEGVERIPRGRPTLLVVNHPNALVDALLVGWTVPWRVLITAKATLFRNRVGAALLHWLGVVPLRRASDERRSGRGLDPGRNSDTFRAVREALARGGTVLIFPEGKSHDEPSLAPLKTGAARMALDARDAGVRGLVIVPIGLTFERKDAPRTRVLVQVGEAISMDAWQPGDGGRGPEALTAQIDARLRSVTLNYASNDDAARTIRLASTIAALLGDVQPIGKTDRSLHVDAEIARRITDLSTQLTADERLRDSSDRLVNRLEALEREASDRGILVEDIGIRVASGPALRFIVREGWLLMLGGPVALWGRLNHWLPFRAARLLALRSPDGASDPAMRTLVAGAAFVLITYFAQTAVVAAAWGADWAALYLLSLPIAADINFWLSDRLMRSARRARAFFTFRRDPSLQHRLATELDQLRNEVIALDRAADAFRAVAEF